MLCNKIKSCSLISIFILLHSFVHGQILIKGNVKSDSKSIEGVSVYIHDINSKNAILHFTITDEYGNFEFQLDTLTNNLAITTSSLSYSDTTVRLNKNFAHNYKFNLHPKLHDLKTINVKGDYVPLSFKKDTVVYNVKSFAAKGDISLSDVISKMPGLTISDDGKIYYQNEAIEKFYIEGLDLLEGKYQLANKNLPHQAVKSVEVLENHQHVKMLDNMVFTDKTSINIKLEKKLNLIGTAELGIGLSPLLWNAKITPMLFTKKQQIIASYQANNVGDDVSSQLNTFSFEEFNAEKQNIVDIASIKQPNIKKERYWDNNINMISYNHLLKMSDDANLKINATYIDDVLKQNVLKTTQFFLKNDTISSNELIDNNVFKNQLKLDAVFENNSNNKFVKNKLGINKYWDNKRGILNGKTTDIKQEANLPFISLNNYLNWMQKIGQNLFTFKSKLIYYEAPQNLVVNKGIFKDIINAGKEYKRVNQEILLKNFAADNSINFMFGLNHFKFFTEFGLVYNIQNFSSFMYIDNKMNNDNIFINKLQNNLLTLRMVETLSYELRDFVFELKLPLEYTNFNSLDTKNEIEKELSKIFFKPDIYLHYKINGYWSVRLGASYTEDFDNSWKILHNAYFLYDYHNLSRYNSPLLQQQIQNYTTYIKYVNPIYNWFANLKLLYYRTNQNLLYKYDIADDGSKIIRAELSDNDTQGSSIFFNIHKLFTKLRTTIYLTTRYNYRATKNFTNNKMYNINNNSYYIEPRISITKFSFVNIDYKFKYSVFLQNNEYANVKFIDKKQQIKLNILPANRHLLGIDFELYENNNDIEKTQSFFANVDYSWKPKNTRLTIKLKCFNLFNKAFVSDNFYSTNYIVLNHYNIRARQYIVSVLFSLVPPKLLKSGKLI